jgi:hypothetical protein
MSLKDILLILILACLVYARFQYNTTSNSCNTTSCTFNLAYTGPDDYYQNPKSPILKNLTVLFKALTVSDFTIKILDSNNQSRFEVPQGNGFPEDPYRNFSFPLVAASYSFTYTLQPFDFRCARK